MSDHARVAYAAVSDTLAGATALPRAAFADPQVFAAEQAGVFRAGWIPVARESDLAEAGAYRSVDIGGAPLVVTRDAAGEIHVLSRICRHRGMPVVEGSGVAKALTCPYHLWRYGLDGKLAAAPAMERSEVFDREDCDLPAIATARWNGWIFANIDGKAPPLEPQIAPLTARVAAFAPQAMVTVDTISLESPWNWKLMVENFMESYHHIGPHIGSLQQSNPGLGTYESDGADLFTILENPPAEGDHHGFVVAAIFPTTLLFFSEGTPLGTWYELDSIEHGRFRLNIHLLASPDLAAIPEFVAGFRAQALAIHDEDIPVCEGAQKGVTSPLYIPGPLSHLEASVWRLHRFLKMSFEA
ncbi:aromatic ring-hydroxylating dioxygenase subunit alpha [Phenylobacterium sp.]|uniref:aromatic ring-hydroxylating oxygenase subunit alpha n=1 Tax=Phenylobacterium sp. TaxID=1871053 RepID=UPI00271BE52F|nr:aromatic ring-hydroxylating dioxygenase subunit alpha [Phenylobacterium sp.]MDO8802093.1 aromatic ring-hydroxylating dioxygenase subunit alpha [Phenylobacterium sp.]